MGAPKLAREPCGARQAPGPRAGMWDALARLGYPDWPVWQGSSLRVGSDLLKFEEPVSTQEQGTFSFRTPKVRLPGWVGQAGGPRGLALRGLPSCLRGLRGGRGQAHQLPFWGSGAGRHVWPQSIPGPPISLESKSSSVSEPPASSHLEASPCCPSAVRGHTVVTLGGSGGRRGCSVSLCAPSSSTMPTRRCLCICMSSPTARISTAGSKVGGLRSWAGGRARAAGRPCRRPASPSAVTLYNCSFGRSDCSLCLAADPVYRCVWCSGQSRCVYAALCGNATSECPPPVITRVSPLTPDLPGRRDSSPARDQLRSLACPSHQVSRALPISDPA